MITASVESLTANLPEIKTLLNLHWEELALNKDKVPLDPQYWVYEKRDADGEVLHVALRNEGKLIGYFVGFVNPGLHYQTCLTLIMDIFFLHPEYRGHKGGILLFKTVELEAKRRGVDRIYLGSKEHKPVGVLFERLGYDLVERTYSKFIGE